MTAFYATAILALAPGQAPAAERPTVLVLDDYTLVEGQVTEIPDFHDATGETKLYRVASGGQLRTLTAGQVLFRGGTRQEAYRFVKGKWVPTSVDGHIKLAEWCRDAGLVSEALDEAGAAATLGPPDAYLAKLIHELEAKRAEERTVRIVRPPTTVAVTSTPKIVEKPAVDPTVEKAFGQKVQPILANACLSCHCDPRKPSAFVLSRIPEGESNGPAAWRNLAATRAQVRGDAPEQSPLLTYATRPHGGQSQPALTVRHPAYQHLTAWATAVATGLPKTAAPKPQSPAPTVKIAVGPAPADPFDPAAFNHPTGPAKKP